MLRVGVLLVALAGAAVAAEEWDEHRVFAEHAPWLVSEVERDGDPDPIAPARKQPRVSALIDFPITDAYPVPAGERVAIGDHEIGLVAFDKGHREGLGHRVVEWRFTLAEDGEWMVRSGDDHLSGFTLDGHPLHYAAHGLWFAEGADGPGHRLAAGEHRLLAFYRVPHRHDPVHIDLQPVLDVDTLALRLDGFVQSASGAERLERMRAVFDDAYRAAAAPLGVIATYLRRYVATLRDADLEDDRDQLRRLGDMLEDLIEHGPSGDEAWRALLAIDALPRDLLIAAMAAEGKDHREIANVVRALLEADRPDIADAVLRAAIDARADDSKHQRQLWEVSRWVADTAIEHTGHFDQARDWLVAAMEPLKDDDGERKRIAQGLSRIDFLGRGASSLITDPVAAQAHHELGPLLERGTADARTIDSILELVVNGAGALRDAGSRAVDQALESMDRVARFPELAAALRAEAGRKLERAAATALRRGDLDRIDALLNRYQLITDVAPLHLAALRRRMDLRDDAAARRHALALLDHADEAVRTEAWASLLVIEGALGLTAGERARPPQDVARVTRTVGGREIRIGDLAERHGLIAAPPVTASVGRVLGAQPRPPSLPGFAMGDRHQNDDIKAPRWWARPAASGEVVAYADPTALVVCDRDSGDLRWIRSAEAVPGWHRETLAHRFAVCATDGLLLHHTVTHGGGLTVRAYDHDGALQWDLADDPGRDGWRPWTVPTAVGGSAWLLLTRKPPRAATEVAVGRIDLRSGQLRDVQVVMQLGAEQGASSGLFDQRFCVNERGAVFGATGLGSVFRIDPLSGRLLWIAKLPPTPEGRPLGAGWIGAGDEVVTAYLPERQQWVAFDIHDGSVRWRRYDSRIQAVHSLGVSDPVISRGYGGGSTVDRIDPVTGELRWRTWTGGAAVTGEGSVVGDQVLVPTVEGVLVLDFATGAVRARIPFSEQDCYSLVHHGDRCSLVTDDAWYLCATDGELDLGSVPRWSLVEPVTGLLLPDLRAGFEVVHETDHPFDDDENLRDRNQRVIHDPASSRLLLYDAPRIAAIDFGGMVDGVRRGPRTLWQRHYHQTRVGPDGAIGWYPRRLDRMTSEGVTWTYRPRGLRGRVGHFETAIVDAAFAGEHVVVRHDDNRLVLLRAADGAVVASQVAKGSVKALWGSVVLVELRNPDRLVAIDIANDGEELWTLKEYQDRAAWSTAGDYRVGIRGKDLYVIDLKTGQQRTLRNKSGDDYRWHEPQAGTVFGSRVVNAAGQIFDLASGEVVEHDRAAIDAVGGGALLFDGDKDAPTVTLVYAEGQVELTGLTSTVTRRWYDQAGEDRLAIGVIGDRAFVEYGTALYQFDLADGALASWYPHGFHDSRVLPVRGGFLLIDDRKLRVAVTDAAAVDDRLQLMTRVAEPGDDGWPRSGWAAPMRFEPGHWLAGAGANKPAAAYGVQMGFDDEQVYLRLVRGRSVGEHLVTHLAVAASDEVDGKRLRLRWDAANRDGPAGSDHFHADMRAWRHTMSDGRGDFRIAIPKEAMGLAEDAPPMLHWEITEYDADGLRGRWRLGNTLDEGERDRKREEQRVVADHPADRAAREAIYRAGSGFIPQGRELAHWLLARRLADPRADNQVLLADMLERTAGHASAANVIACWYLERVRDLADGAVEGPELTDPEFVEACQRIADDLAATARDLGVPEALITVGLTRVEGLALEVSIYDHWPRLMDRIELHGRKHKRLEVGVELDDPCAFGRPGVRYLSVPLGLFSGGLGDDLESVRFEELRGAVMLLRWALRMPGRDPMRLVDPDGTLADGVEIDGERAGGRTVPSLAGPAFQIWLHGHRTVTLSHPRVELPDIGEYRGLAPADIVRAIDALPSNSGSADDLIDAYREAVGENEGLSNEELAVRALRRVGTNGSATLDLTDDLFEDLDERRRIERLNELYEEAGVDRWVRRWVLLHLRDTISRGAWQHLGPWPVSRRADTRPEDAAEPLMQAYRVVAQTEEVEEEAEEFHFRRLDNPGNALNDFRGLDGTQRMYHLSTLVLRDDKKVFLFLGHHDHRREGGELSVWVDGRAEAVEERIPKWSQRVIALPLRLPAGRHQILIGENFHRHWGLRVMVGDTDGAPMPGVELTAP